jgi:hypothetical protein
MDRETPGVRYNPPTDPRTNAQQATDDVNQSFTKLLAELNKPGSNDIKALNILKMFYKAAYNMTEQAKHMSPKQTEKSRRRTLVALNELSNQILNK